MRKANYGLLLKASVYILLSLYDSEFFNTKGSILMARSSPIKKVCSFYRSGFAGMPDWGVRLWIIILVKLFVIFFILRIFFFPDFLKKNFRSDSERSMYILKELTEKT